MQSHNAAGKGADARAEAGEKEGVYQGTHLVGIIASHRALSPSCVGRCLCARPPLPIRDAHGKGGGGREGVYRQAHTVQYVFGAARYPMLFLERGYDGLDLLWRRFASWTCTWRMGCGRRDARLIGNERIVPRNLSHGRDRGGDGGGDGKWRKRCAATRAQTK